MSRYFEDDEEKKTHEDIENELMEYAEYIYQRNKDDELTEKHIELDKKCPGH